MNQKACYTGLPNISSTVCISRTRQSRSELSADLTGVNVEVGWILFLFISRSHLWKCVYNLAIRKCTSPPFLAPRSKIFKWKFTSPPWIEPGTCWIRGRHATIWASTPSVFKNVECAKIKMIKLWQFENSTKLSANDPKHRPIAGKSRTGCADYCQLPAQ